MWISCRQVRWRAASATDDEITLRFHRRAHLPIVLASGLFNKPIKVPWWNGRALRLLQ
jgi:hypothetical protein